MDEIKPQPNDDTSEKKFSTFECRVCLEPAVWPVVTACGHLYCWQCLSTWLIKGQKECPVCKSGCTEETITPIYSGEEQPTDHPKNQPRPRGRREDAPARSTAGEWHSSFHLGSAFGFVPFLGFTYVSVAVAVQAAIR
ncbi:MAG: uncharacterized protein KVP18_005177 [Porospora cf. gigantea A]|uniref:uncharacterized protein n=1 Tax=Porospora cf. gigantea A TaxID=2853593 RepID=UPI00355A9C03|nr:MAG: hypothetical protein KVP18_005177 [Porospora cf. gigantea A]